MLPPISGGVGWGYSAKYMTNNQHQQDFYCLVAVLAKVISYRREASDKIKAILSNPGAFSSKYKALSPRCQAFFIFGNVSFISLVFAIVV